MSKNPFPQTGRDNYMPKLTITDVDRLKDKYDFIITTATRTIDTSKYNTMLRHNSTIGGIIQGQEQILWLTSIPGFTWGHQINKGDELICVLEDSVKSIEVKQKKGHPWNGQPAQL